MELYNIVGNIGVALIVTTYLLVQTERMPLDSLRFSLFNGVGAACVLVSLRFEFNASAFLVESFWLLISTYGVMRHVRRRRRPTQA